MKRSKFFVFCLAYWILNAQAWETKFKAEDIIEPKAPTVACVTPEELIIAFKMANSGEKTRLSALLDSGRCVLTGPGQKLRVLTVEKAPVIEVIPFVRKESSMNGFFVAEPGYKKSVK